MLMKPRLRFSGKRILFVNVPHVFWLQLLLNAAEKRPTLVPFFHSYGNLNASAELVDFVVTHEIIDFIVFC